MSETISISYGPNLQLPTSATNLLLFPEGKWPGAPFLRFADARVTPYSHGLRIQTGGVYRGRLPAVFNFSWVALWFQVVRAWTRILPLSGGSR